MLSDAERALLRQDEVEMLEREEAATEGPWKQSSDEGHIWSGDDNKPRVMVVAGFRGRSRFNDCEFIANARTDVPELIRRLAAARAGERELLDALEFVSHCGHPQGCGVCVARARTVLANRPLPSPPAESETK